MEEIVSGVLRQEAGGDQELDFVDEGVDLVLCSIGVAALGRAERGVQLGLERGDLIALQNAGQSVVDLAGEQEVLLVGRTGAPEDPGRARRHVAAVFVQETVDEAPTRPLPRRGRCSRRPWSAPWESTAAAPARTWVCCSPVNKLARRNSSVCSVPTGLLFPRA